MPKRNTYEVIDIFTNNVVFTGDGIYLSEKLGWTSETIRKHSLNGLPIEDRYIIRKNGTVFIKKNTSINKRKKEKYKKQSTIEYLIHNLKIFGNTVLNTNPDKYKKELLENGIEIKWEKSKDELGTVYYIITKAN